MESKSGETIVTASESGPDVRELKSNTRIMYKDASVSFIYGFSRSTPQYLHSVTINEKSKLVHFNEATPLAGEHSRRYALINEGSIFLKFILIETATSRRLEVVTSS